MTRPGDLATVLGGGAPGLELRIGVIRTWNAANGQSTVDTSGSGAAGATITNPMVCGALAGYAVGTRVALLGSGGRWLILGVLTIPPP